MLRYYAHIWSDYICIAYIMSNLRQLSKSILPSAVARDMDIDFLHIICIGIAHVKSVNGIFVVFVPSLHLDI